MNVGAVYLMPILLKIHPSMQVLSIKLIDLLEPLQLA